MDRRDNRDDPDDGLRWTHGGGRGGRVAVPAEAPAVVSNPDFILKFELGDESAMRVVTTNKAYGTTSKSSRPAAVNRDRDPSNPDNPDILDSSDSLDERKEGSSVVLPTHSCLYCSLMFFTKAAWNSHLRHCHTGGHR